MESYLYQEIADLIRTQGRAALCVIVEARGSTPRAAGAKMLVYPDGKISGTIGGGEMEHRVIQAALEAMTDGEPKLVSYAMTDPQRGDPGVCGGQLEVYVEPILPQPTVIVVGAGHVGRELARLASWLNYVVVISDDRPEMLTDDLAEFAKMHSGPMEQLGEFTKIHSQTYLVLTTRNVEIDAAGLPTLIDSEAAYIGVIGSRRRWQITKEKLLEQGVDADKMSRVYSPVGLELNAETPEEIAISILAQIIQHRRGGHGRGMASEQA